MQKKQHPGKYLYDIGCAEGDGEPLRLRGRSFTFSELTLIRELVHRHWSDGRTRISEEVCKALQWRQPNGWLKDRACRDVLRALEELGVLKLPADLRGNTRCQYSQWSPREYKFPVDIIPSNPVTSLGHDLCLKLAKGDEDERMWNALVQQYHYLGHKVTVGRCLKFLVMDGPNIIGAVALSDAAWAVKARDVALDMLEVDRLEVLNNSRFLILPMVRVKCLASRVLALLARDGVSEWERYYCTKVQCLETFVDSLRFQGTSYKAANWVRVGETSGYRKSGQVHYNSQTPKFVFLYPLDARKRARLAHACKERAD